MPGIDRGAVVRYVSAGAMLKRAQEEGSSSKPLQGYVERAMDVARANPEASGAGVGALLGAILSQTGGPVGEVERSDRYRRLKNLMVMTLAGGAIGATAGHYYPSAKSLFVKSKSK